ncbi:unnamed protein product [Agarophyton chilense]
MVEKHHLPLDNRMDTMETVIKEIRQALRQVQTKLEYPTTNPVNTDLTQHPLNTTQSTHLGPRQHIQLGFQSTPQQGAPQQTDLLTMARELAEMRVEMETLRNENQRLLRRTEKNYNPQHNTDKKKENQAGMGQKQQSVPQPVQPDNSQTQTSEHPRKTWDEIAAHNAPIMRVLEPKMRDRISKAKVLLEENNLASTPFWVRTARPVSIYFAGMRRGPIGRYRRAITTAIPPRLLHGISFVGRSIGELIVQDSIVDRTIVTMRALGFRHLPEIDPLWYTEAGDRLQARFPAVFTEEGVLHDQQLCKQLQEQLTAPHDGPLTNSASRDPDYVPEMAQNSSSDSETSLPGTPTAANTDGFTLVTRKRRRPSTGSSPKNSRPSTTGRTKPSSPQRLRTAGSAHRMKARTQQAENPTQTTDSIAPTPEPSQKTMEITKVDSPPLIDTITPTIPTPGLPPMPQPTAAQTAEPKLINSTCPDPRNSRTGTARPPSANPHTPHASV